MSCPERGRDGRTIPRAVKYEIAPDLVGVAIGAACRVTASATTVVVRHRLCILF